MSSIAAADLALTLEDDPPVVPPDEATALARYPKLRGFRAALGRTELATVPGPARGAQIMAKYEFTNPFGSVKDRPAYALLCSAISRHTGPEPLKLLDYTGGNFGLAMSGLGALTGIPIRLTLTDSTPPSILRRLLADDTILDEVDAAEFLYGIIRRAMQIAEDEPSWTFLHQMRNMANLSCHEFGTGQEIIEQLGERVPRYLVAAIGTGGTLAGVGRRLRRQYPGLKLVGVTPAELPYGTAEPPNGKRKSPGGGGIGYGLRQPFVADLATDATHRHVAYPQALAAMREFRSLTGLRIGASAAAAWWTAREIASSLPAEEVVLTVFPDAGTTEDWDQATA
jgi:cysteine synthase